MMRAPSRHMLWRNGELENLARVTDACGWRRLRCLSRARRFSVRPLRVVSPLAPSRYQSESLPCHVSGVVGTLRGGGSMWIRPQQERPVRASSGRPTAGRWRDGLGTLGLALAVAACVPYDRMVVVTAVVPVSNTVTAGCANDALRGRCFLTLRTERGA
jgi:hypothetical protein